MSYKAAVQVLKSADLLKIKLLSKYDLLNDIEAWSIQQQLQTIYHQVLVLDLEYALDKKVEQELWTLGFKNHISKLQQLVKDKKNLRKSESQALLAWSLESASGFYLSLLQELCNTFDIDLQFRRHGCAYGLLKSVNTPLQLIPQSSSCLYICQYCLVHLGDIARYRNQRNQAESFYSHAIAISPTSGHPYNQLALLEASQGDTFSTVFHYAQGITVKKPFPVTATNLNSTFLTIMKENRVVKDVSMKMTIKEFINLFLEVHGLLYTLTDLEQARLTINHLNSTLAALVASQNFTDGKLIKMTVINMFALYNITGIEIMKTTELTNDEIIARELTLDLLAGSLSAFLLPIYTLKTNESILEYYALPAIKLVLYWIETNPDVLKEISFQKRLQIWPGLCKLLNGFQPYIIIENNRYTKVPLPEDLELQGFLPLAEKYKEFDFKSHFVNSLKEESQVRAYRITMFGKWLTTLDINNTKLIISKNDIKSNDTLFEPGCLQPDPTGQLLEEINSLNTVEGATTNLKERRCGILKPQGSLEKAKEEREMFMNFDGTKSCEPNKFPTSDGFSNYNQNYEIAKFKRAKQNVALQSIYKKIEENKQVKFHKEISYKEKEKINPHSNLTTTASSCQSFRTQTFNQNHPAFPIPQNTMSKDHFNTARTNRTSTILPDQNMADNMVFLHKESEPVTDKINLPFVMHKNNVYSNNSNFALNLPNTARNIPNIESKPTQPSISSTGIMYTRPPPPLHPYQMTLKNNAPIQHQFRQPPQPQPHIAQPGPFDATWNSNDPSASTGTWWTHNQQMPSSTQNTVLYPYSTNRFGSDYNKPNMFNNSWLENISQNNQQGMANYKNAKQAISMRQAMLNESNVAGVSSKNIPPDKLSPKAAGYSLFSSSSWTPNLPGQARIAQNDVLNSMSAQSLFSMNSPSLQQLLEQQAQMNDDK